ncbi:MAG: PKD domain-containing protein, partial [Hymenobacter sp.]
VSSPPLPLSGLPSGGIWTGPGVSGSVATGFVFTPSMALAGTQVLTYTVPGATAACTASARLTITVASPVVATAAAQAAVCAGSGPVALTGGSPAGGVWSGPGVSGSVAAGFVFTPTLALVGPQQLAYTVTNTATCGGSTSRATATITVLNAPTVLLPADTVLCPGRGQAFRLRATPAGGVWSGVGISAGNLFTPPALPGTTVLTYTVNAGTACPVVATRRIMTLGDVNYSIFRTEVLCPNSLFNATPTVPHTVRVSSPLRSAGRPLPAGSVVITWDFGDGSPPVKDSATTHTYTKAGTFRIKATISLPNGACQDSLSLSPLTIEPAFVPNVFTPNADGQNDLFTPRLGGCPPRLQVFSRWGQLVYEHPTYQNSWDGTGL